MPLRIPDKIEWPATTTTSSTIWLGTPFLGNTPGRKYLGRVVVEVWENDALFFDQRLTEDEDVLHRAIVALLNTKTRPSTISPWTDKPLLGSLNDQSFLGRVVIEVWDGQCNLCISGSETLSTMTRRASKALGAGLKVHD